MTIALSYKSKCKPCKEYAYPVYKDCHPHEYHHGTHGYYDSHYHPHYAYHPHDEYAYYGYPHGYAYGHTHGHYHAPSYEYGHCPKAYAGHYVAAPKCPKAKPCSKSLAPCKPKCVRHYHTHDYRPCGYAKSVHYPIFPYPYHDYYHASHKHAPHAHKPASTYTHEWPYYA